MQAETLPREIGDLHPVRDVLAWLDGETEKDRKLRPEGDPVLHALAEVRKRLVKAINDACNPDLELSPQELAKQQGVTKWAIYKRRARGHLPEAKKRRDGRIAIPAAKVE